MVAECRFAFDVVECGRDEGIAFEVATHLFEVAIHGALTGAIEAKTGMCRERELLLGIGIEHTIEADNALFPLLDDADQVVVALEQVNLVDDQQDRDLLTGDTVQDVLVLGGRLPAVGQGD